MNTCAICGKETETATIRRLHDNHTIRVCAPNPTGDGSHIEEGLISLHEPGKTAWLTVTGPKTYVNSETGRKPLPGLLMRVLMTDEVMAMLAGAIR